MISLRYHAVSIGAVFLALAVGVLMGAGGVSDRVLSAVVTESADLDGQVQELTAERDRLAGAQRGAEEFAARIGPAAVRGLLPEKAITLVTSGADQDDRAAVLDLIATTGAVVSGEVALTPA